MGKDVWLMGVYRGELVTANEHYKKEFWARLLELRKSNFLGYNKKRIMLAPYFCFLKPVKDAERLKDIPSEITPEDYGLPDIAYESTCNTPNNCQKFMIPAKGVCKQNCFVIDLPPPDVAPQLQQNGISVLALIDRRPGTLGTSRTGTFFRYELKSKEIVFTPLTYRDGYIVGKGVIAGAWKADANLWGRMIRHQYIREKHCPINIGSSRFRKDGFTHYITYRRVETDLRLDMPAVLLYLAKVGGFKHLANNFGKSLNHPFGRHIDQILKQDILADGTIVDYEDINGFSDILFDIREDPELLGRMVEAVFKLLFVSAIVSIYCGNGLLTILKGEKEKGKVAEFTKKNFTAINDRYRTLCREFLNGLSEENREYFNGKKNEKIPSVENMPYYFKEVTGLDPQQ